MVLQHSLVGKSLLWHSITITVLNAKVGIYPPSYVVIPSFISCFASFTLGSLLHFKLIILVCLAFLPSIQLAIKCNPLFHMDSKGSHIQIARRYLYSHVLIVTTSYAIHAAVTSTIV